MANIIVAGGAGFIGSHFCEFLLEKNHKVICIDNFSTGSKKNVSHLLGGKNFKLLNQDITKKFSISGKIHFVCNLASPASPVDYQEKPLETLEAGSLGVKNLLNIAKQKKAVFLFASTSEVYGNPLEHPQKETYWGNVNPIGPRSCYDEAKRFGEAYTIAFSKMNQVDVKIARIFNTYGPRMRKNDGRVVPNFIEQALYNKPITVYGKGNQTRSFCYVTDLVAGLYALMNSSERGPVNLGNPYETTILELAKTIIVLTKSPSKIVFEGLPVDDPERRLPDISLAIKKFGWQPRVSLKNGLIKTIAFFTR